MTAIPRSIGRLILFSCLCLTVVPGVTARQQEDSLRTYDLEEIIVGAAPTDGRSLQVSDAYRVALSDLRMRTAMSVDGLIRLLPSASVQTNSRGETIVSVRGAPERQVAILLDGVPLAVPWDGRMDLSMLPAGMAGGLSVVRGVPGPASGPNTATGAVRLQTRSLSGPGRLTEVGLAGGNAGMRSLEGLHASRGRRGALLVGASTQMSDGMPLPGGADLPFEDAGGLRKNTDRRVSGGVVRFDANGVFAVTAMHVDSRKGIAAEGHLDPSVNSPRYWRYPNWKNSMLIVGGQPLSWLQASTWLGRFSQDINSYPDANYAVAEERQSDEDRTAGIRTAATATRGAVSIGWTTFHMTSSHHQVESDLIPSRATTSDLRYRSTLSSSGLDVTWASRSNVRLQVGASVDRMGMPRTGDKPERDAFVDWSGRATAQVGIARGWTGHASAGRKIRFPTMRELFGDALRRFVVNPDLEGEKVRTLETGLVRVGSGWRAEFLVFVRHTDDAIDLENVVVDGETKRRRVNRNGSRVWGMEWIVGAQIADGTRADGHLMWLRPSVDGGHVMETPEVLSTIWLRHRVTRQITLHGGLEYTGRAWGLAEDNSVVSLPKAAVFSARVSWQQFLADSRIHSEIFLALNNLTDAVTLPQLGLPGAGRMLRVGASFTR